MNKKILILLFIGWFHLFIGASPILAQETYSSDTIVTDRGQVKLWEKSVPEERIEAYRKQSDFNYDFTVVKQESIWSRFIHWVQNWLGFLIKGLGVVWYLRYIILAALIIFLISLIYRGKFTGLFNTNQNITSIEFSDSANPTKVNWEEKIREALLHKEYRLAVRYHFLSILKKLSEKKLIVWKSEKTNYDYIREIKQARIKTDFIELSELYEAVWYGDFPIMKQDYDQIETEFGQLNLLLSQEKEFAL
ncbi:hypothetical protein BZG02_06610 [Labilibaculum filiforme]|uniref:Protein-glutamine gamma-glutamyltransferase-like C-terminal domain-containing protein n=1 Tax=Labilibaculum filiforme TaxID=1940526 RepID=A0A2N3I2I0_9BACT|nr:DUF4129 domain-containing protein [Labilibaculum filiforme]PKQ64473.1 hypothetical protein BZG02_06610 [Labilibaculum filiforme]